MGAKSTKQLVTVDGKTYKKKQVLGEGRSGYVFLVKEKQTKIRYAVKQIFTQDREHLELANQEAELLKKVSPHPNIVRYIAHATVPEPLGGKTLYILTEWCSGGGLSDVIAARAGSRFPENEALGIFVQVCRGVSKLHNLRPQPIAHRDIKVENIVVQEDGSYKLCDLGSATARSKAAETAREKALLAEDVQRMTTAQYRAPEMVDTWSGKEVSERADLWALGCLLFYLAFFTHAFPEGGNAQVLSGKFEVPPDSPFSSTFHALIASLLRVEPSERPDVDTVLQVLAGTKTPAALAAASPAPPGEAPAPRRPATHAEHGTQQPAQLSETNGGAQPLASTAEPVLAEQQRTRGASGAYCHQACFKRMEVPQQSAFALGH